MDEIIYLEPDEEITSVIDKVKQAKNNRLSLVVPRQATLLQSVINLRLLAKEATMLGKEIALVTSDKIGRNLAARVGLKVYDSIKSQQPIFQPPPPIATREEIIEINDAPKVIPPEIRPKGVQVHHFQEPDQTFKKKQVALPTAPSWQAPKVHREVDFSRYRKIIWPMLAICILLILIGAFLVFPMVNVQIKVKAESFQKTVDLQVSENSTRSEDKNFQGALLDLAQEKEEKFATTGKKNLGGKATGTLTIYNNLDSNTHSYNAGAKLSSSSKTFILKDSVSVPGATVQNLKIVPGTVSADIEAENPGEDYNVKAGRFTMVGSSSNQQEAIYGQSSKDLTGGFSKEVQVVSQNDYDLAKSKITEALTNDLKKELEEKSEGREILDSAMQLDPVEEVVSAKVDSEAQEFTLKLRLRLREVVFERSGFDQFVLKILESEIPSDKMITLGPSDTISPQVKEKKYDQKNLLLNVNVSAKISTRMDIQRVKDNILGKNKNQIENYLQSLEGTEGAEISYFPNWWPIKRIPNFQRNVVVGLNYFEPTPTPTPTPTSSPTNP